MGKMRTNLVGATGHGPGTDEAKPRPADSVSSFSRRKRVTAMTPCGWTARWSQTEELGDLAETKHGGHRLPAPVHSGQPKTRARVFMAVFPAFHSDTGLAGRRQHRLAAFAGRCCWFFAGRGLVDKGEICPPVTSSRPSKSLQTVKFKACAVHPVLVPCQRPAGFRKERKRRRKSRVSPRTPNSA